MYKTQKSITVVWLLICFFYSITLHAQHSLAGKQKASKEAVKKEIVSALELWNKSCKNRDINQTMGLFDKSPGIMVVGSDSGEVFTGKEQIESWMNMLFAHRSFSWEMSRVDIDSNGNTAWVFMDGFMIVSTDKGKTAKFPYRITGILVKVKNDWKWRLFDGAVPGGH
jgi:ketosteroid isomerase-like protein